MRMNSHLRRFVIVYVYVRRTSTTTRDLLEVRKGVAGMGGEVNIVNVEEDTLHFVCLLCGVRVRAYVCGQLI